MENETMGLEPAASFDSELQHKSRLQSVAAKLMMIDVQVQSGGKMSASYRTLGTYAVHEAKALLTAFEQAGLRFNVRVDERHFKNMPVAQSLQGGRFGLSRTVVIDVHSDDFQVAHAMIPKIFKCEV